MNSFVHVFSMRTDSFILRILKILTGSFHVFSVHTDSFRVIGVCTQKTWIFGTKLFSSKLLKGYYKKSSEGELLGLKSTRPNYYFALAWREKCFRINWLYVEWPWNSNIKFIYKNNRGSELGDHVGSFDEKNLRLKTFQLLTYLLQK